MVAGTRAASEFLCVHQNDCRAEIGDRLLTSKLEQQKAVPGTKHIFGVDDDFV